MTTGNADIIAYLEGINKLEAAVTAILLNAICELAEDAYEEYISAGEDLEELMERQLAMTRTLHDHVLGVTHPFLQYAMQAAFDYPVLEPDYGGSCARMAGGLLQSTDEAIEASAHYHKLFCMDDECSAGTLGYYGGIAAVDSAYARARHQERRKDRQKQERIGVIQKAHAGTMRNPEAAFGLMQNAGEIFASLQASAFGNYSGSLALFGSALGFLSGGVSAAGTTSGAGQA